jgi:hypothetical protein
MILIRRVKFVKWPHCLKINLAEKGARCATIFLRACSESPHFHLCEVFTFSPFFPSKLKQIGKSMPYIGYQNIMENNYYAQKRELAENVWYGVVMAINIGEPLSKQDWA